MELNERVHCAYAEAGQYRHSQLWVARKGRRLLLVGDLRIRQGQGRRRRGRPPASVRAGLRLRRATTGNTTFGTSREGPGVEGVLTAHSATSCSRPGRGIPRKGWRPDVLAPHWDGERYRFMLVFRDNPEPVDWRLQIDMNLQDYKKASAEEKEKGRFPLSRHLLRRRGRREVRRPVGALPNPGVGTPCPRPARTAAAPTRAAPPSATTTAPPSTASGDSSAIDAGSRPFSAPFVLPTGKSCRNFNQLALACREDPAAALTVLAKGHLETFLGAQGRTDLAEAAHAARGAAARTANGERALDDFLGQLPAPALLPARLRVEPEVIDLGTMHPGEDRRCELVLQNKGMRLLFGSASCDGCPWLSLGDGPERQRMLFQFSGRAVIPLRVQGGRLHAYRDPQQGEVRLESNGGTVTVTVRVRVAVRPFPEGVLAGALSPRELASKARDVPKEAAALVESGAVARWYAANGWTYPVAGPTATGTAAVQQLFEALGLVKPPRVELGEESVELRGSPGQKFEYVLAVVTQENRAVVAHGSSDQPWLRVGPTVFRGRSAFLPLNVAAVPDRPGETLRAQVSVTANGNQRFVVPVTLSVAGPSPRRSCCPSPARPRSRSPPRPRRRARRCPGARPGWIPSLPAGVLALVLLGVVARDYFAPAGPGPKPPPQDDPVPRVEIRFHDAKRDDVLDKVWLTDPAPTMRFGLVTLYKGKPVGGGAAVNRLTFDPWGRTNNACLRFDGKDERLFGSARGRWEAARRHTARCGSATTCTSRSRRPVELVRGESSRLLDTCQVRYRIENRDKAAHTVGVALPAGHLHRRQRRRAVHHPRRQRAVRHPEGPARGEGQTHPRLPPGPGEAGPGPPGDGGPPAAAAGRPQGGAAARHPRRLAERASWPSRTATPTAR